MKTNVLIIGAGYYGISTACYLAQKNISFIIIGKPFTLWFNHILGDAALRSELIETEMYVPGSPYNLIKFIKKQYPGKAKEMLKKEISMKLFKEYLTWIKKELSFKINENEAISIRETKEGFHTILANKEKVDSKAIVIATGMGVHRYIPKCLTGFHSKKILHAWDVNQYKSLKNKKILIIGTGQSAAEALNYLKKNNELIWVTRHAPTFYKDPIKVPAWLFKLLIHVSPYLYLTNKTLRKIIPKNSYRSTITPSLKKTLESPEIRKIYASVQDLHLKKKGNEFVSEKYRLEAEIIISATGYKYDLEKIAFLSPEIREGIKKKEMSKLVDKNFETAVKNVFVIGGITEPVHGIAQRFLFGARHAARKVSSIIEKRYKKRSTQNNDL